MPNNLKLLPILAALLLSACSSLNTKEHTKSYHDQKIPSAYRNSWNSWLNLKERHHAFYSYERDSLTEEGFHSSTKLTIINDQVEYRDFFEWQQGNAPTLTWSEDYAQLGQHNQGASVKTLDELYQQCKNEVLSKPAELYALLFQVDQLNVMKQCSFTLKNCDKNCTKGIRIQGLTLK